MRRLTQAFAVRGFGAAAKTHFEGISPTEYQAITSAAYADFTAATIALDLVVRRRNVPPTMPNPAISMVQLAG